MPDRRTLLTALALLPFWPQEAGARAPEILATGGIALGGTDVVTYALAGGPVPGDPRFALMWRGATWHFAGARTMETFEMDPGRYCPAYGGHCAWALARAVLMPSQPEAFAAHAGRLYLFSSPEAQRDWLARRDEMIGQADANWLDAIAG